MQKAGVTYLNNQNTYLGTTTPAAGAIGLGASTVGSPGAITSGPIGTGVMLLMADSSSASPSAAAEVFASGGDRTIANAIQFASTTNDLQLLVGAPNSLTFTGPASLNGNDNFSPAVYTNRTISVSNSTTFAGVISDGGKGIGLIKNGFGALYLNGPNTYTGLTRNSTSTTNGLGLLAGSGTIAGPVFVQTNTSIGGGSATVVGSLTINGYLTNNGNVFIRVNKSLSPAQSNDLISVGGALVNAGTGTVIVTNIGVPALAPGDSFQIFSQPVNNGAALAVNGGGVVWSNRLALDGSIQALSVIVTVATNSPYLTNMVAGNTLSFSWALDHKGWTLQVQTNALATGLSTNWANIPGTDQVTSTNVTINPANPSVFYRLIYFP
jgi:autotransporter-associated beta strand protein